MISLKNLKGGSSGGARAVAVYGEHVHDRSKGTGYYAGHGAPSAWRGQGAALLGLQGPVAREDLIAVLEGRLPNGDDVAGRGNVTHRRLGVDLTISAPKSVSIAALTGDHRILAAHDAAVGAALELIEREVLVARQGRGGRRSDFTGTLVAACYRHEDARPVDGHVDPQLHTHCIVVNATRRADGAWSAMDLRFGERSVLMHLADAHYKNELARTLRTLGYELRRTQDGFELAHITDEHIARFSARDRQIREALIERGQDYDEASARTRKAATLATRETKAQGPGPDQRETWRQEARALGISLTPPVLLATPMMSPDLAPAAVRSGVRHLAERDTVFARDALRLEALKASGGDTTLAAVERAIDQGIGGVLDAGRDTYGRQRYTTQTALFREHALLARARAGRGRVVPLMTPQSAQAYITECERRQGFRYTEGQRAALVLGLTSPDRMTGIVGAAGAGKTTSLKGLVSAARSLGREVIGIAPSAKARRELESAGAAVNRTVAAFLAHPHEPNPDRLVLLDEAGMVSAHDLDALLKKLHHEGGRLLLVGDPRQLKAVEAGQPFAQLLQTGAIRCATIDEIQRQVDPKLRAMVQAFARGDAAGAVVRAADYMHAAPAVAAEPTCPTKTERQAAISQATAEAYLALSREGRDRTLVLSGTNAVRRQINALIREGLRGQGELSGPDVRITALDKADLTREQAARAESYAAGLVVRLEAREGRRRTVREYGVVRVDGDRVVLGDGSGETRSWNPAEEKAAGVYQPRAMPLAAGDVVLFRENQGRGDEKIVNGQIATIERADRDGLIARLDDRRAIHLDPQHGLCLDYGWCRTVHAAQGATVERVIVAGEASRAATAELAYVACSRERAHLEIITDNPERLRESWTRWAEHHHALDGARGLDPSPSLDRLHGLRAEAARELGRAGDLARARDALEPSTETPDLEWAR